MCGLRPQVRKGISHRCTPIHTDEAACGRRPQPKNLSRAESAGSAEDDVNGQRHSTTKPPRTPRRTKKTVGDAKRAARASWDVTSSCMRSYSCAESECLLKSRTFATWQCRWTQMIRPEAATKHGPAGAASDAWETRTPPGVKKKATHRRGAESAENPENHNERSFSHHHQRHKERRGSMQSAARKRPGT